MDLTEQGILYMKISPVVFQYLNFHIYCGGMCGRAVNTSNSRSKGSGFKPCPSHCFLRQLYLTPLCLSSPRCKLNGDPEHTARVTLQQTSIPSSGK